MTSRNHSVWSQIVRPLPTEEKPPLAATGRAGRNLPAAVTSALVLIGIAGSTLFFARPAFLVLVGLLVWVAIWEVAGAFARRDRSVAVVPLYVGGAGIFVAGALGSLTWILIGLYLSAVATIAWRMAQTAPRTRPVDDVLASIFTLVYIPFFASFVALISFHSESPWPIVFFVLAIVANDTGGWLAGITFGKHPMAPKLSPKKSWEGFAGSVLLCGAVGYVGTLVMGIDWWWALVVAAVGSVIGTLGDLVESLIKRDAGLKDMSAIVPGHGGLMDRLDSLLFTAPAFFIMYSIAFGW